MNSCSGRRLSLSYHDMMESRIRDVNDALRLLSDLVLKSFDDLSFYEKLSMRYLAIQLVEVSARKGLSDSKDYTRYARLLLEEG